MLDCMGITGAQRLSTIVKVLPCQCKFRLAGTCVMSKNPILIRPLLALMLQTSMLECIQNAHLTACSCLQAT